MIRIKTVSMDLGNMAKKTGTNWLIPRSRDHMSIRFSEGYAIRSMRLN